MKKLLGSLAVVSLLSSLVMAAPGVRGAKSVKTINFSATAAEVCGTSVVVYSVVLSTGAATDFAVVRDSATANTTSSPVVNIPHSTTAVTNVVFDPPLQLFNGLSFNTAATDNADSVTYECGRVTSGY